MIISLIAAASENNVIGRAGEIPWHLPDDLKFFRTKTQGHPIIMGRKTMQSMGKPLPNRHNIVISSHEFPGPPLEFDVVHSLPEALDLAKKDSSEEIFVIGGGQIYNLALPLANRIYLTRVHTTLDGDAFFPILNFGEWKETARQEHLPDEKHQFAFTFLTYERS
jgi:dihydrofolate reductase